MSPENLGNPKLKREAYGQWKTVYLQWLLKCHHPAANLTRTGKKGHKKGSALSLGEDRLCMGEGPGKQPSRYLGLRGSHTRVIRRSPEIALSKKEEETDRKIWLWPLEQNQL